jgi:hypothetical protein
MRFNLKQLQRLNDDLAVYIADLANEANADLMADLEACFKGLDGIRYNDPDRYRRNAHHVFNAGLEVARTQGVGDVSAALIAAATYIATIGKYVTKPAGEIDMGKLVQPSEAQTNAHRAIGELAALVKGEASH